MKYDFSQITKESLQNAVNASTSYFEVLRLLNFPLHGSLHYKVKDLVKEYNINVSHFKGHAWNKGFTVLDDKRVGKYTETEIFVENSPVSTNYIRKLIKQKSLIIYQCEICKNKGNWLDKPLTLQLDHKNGNRTDQKLNNLRWLCPNCHSQTENFCAKNRNHSSVKKVSDEELLNALNKTHNISEALKRVGIYNGGNYYRAYKLLGKLGTGEGISTHTPKGIRS